ncbi:nicotinate (nicotinamide) nucleotide adenylyltransferase [Clostridium felsineum]|uniref:nicotinate (nicotinamide) nucleotide adenylyltransferase n=1 Tax=Clostridium felsineum TaxID=36839 RepID=UPI00214D9581|nr:nicotinate (nicotinamide) nucleotide adenylyltransferase [Clostridium felsineum]MCR3758510.1 nicotinate (nicotinamide) nucleotide adenylyltransferase [Clostridium felsineum]
MIKKNTVLVYGGAFNPPSISHITLAKQLLNFTDAEKLIFLPVGDNYKKRELIPAYHRVNMLKITCEDNRRLEVSTIEVDAKKRLYTVETLDIIKKQNKNKDICFILGTDNLKDIVNWKGYERILTEYKLIVMERGEDTLDKIFYDIPVLENYKDNLIHIKGLLVNDISSSLIRNNIKQKKAIKHLTAQKIIKYINKNKLYEY